MEALATVHSILEGANKSLFIPESSKLLEDLQVIRWSPLSFCMDVDPGAEAGL